MRSLAYFTLAFSAAVLCCHYAIQTQYHEAVALILAMTALYASLKLRHRKRLAILLICTGAILGIVRYDIQVERKITGLSYPIGKEIEISGVVTDFPTQYATYSCMTVRLTNEPFSGELGLFYCYDGKLSVKPGDAISFTAKMASATVTEGVKTDHYISKDIYLRGYIQEIQKVSTNPLAKLKYAPRYVAEFLKNAIDEYMPERTGIFVKALITGEKTGIYGTPEVHHALSAAGIMHVVAVSGMHVSFLLALSLALFGARRGWVIAIPLMAFFALMTGMSPSVMRALFMQSLYVLGPIFHREADGINAISVALFILLLINPFAIASEGLQLSFAAIAGIAVITPRVIGWFEEKGKNLTKQKQLAYQFVTKSLATSIGAVAFSALIAAHYFGSITLLSPLTNLLVLWIIPFCFAGGFLLGLVSIVFPAAAALVGACLSIIVEFVYCVTSWIGSLPIATVYLPQKLITVWFLATYLIIAVTYCKKGKKLYRPLLPMCCSICLLFSALLGIKAYYDQGTTVGAVDVGQGQCIVMLNDSKTLMVDCGGRFDAGDRATKWLKSHGRASVNTLVLTHFDSDHINGVKQLLWNIPVGNIVCCKKTLNPKERIALDEIVQAATQTGTEMHYIDKPSKFYLDEMRVICYVLSKTGGNNGIVVLAKAGAFDLLVTGDMDMESEYELISMDKLPDGECLVAGHHGSKDSTSMVLLDAFSPEYVLISSGYNHYGHPSQQVLDRLEQKNVIVYRTDQMGSVEIKVR